MGHFVENPLNPGRYMQVCPVCGASLNLWASPRELTGVKCPGCGIVMEKLAEYASSVEKTVKELLERVWPAGFAETVHMTVTPGNDGPWVTMHLQLPCCYEDKCPKPVRGT